MLSVGNATAFRPTSFTDMNTTPVRSFRNEAEQPAQQSDKSLQENPGFRQAIKELEQIQQKVIAHERAHMSAGGALAGAATYSYSRGPDGKMYITGGEVSIQMPVTDDPAETIRVMEQVQRAALAVSDPSPQDLKVASLAAMKAQEARMELQKEQLQANNPYSIFNDSGAGLYSQLSILA